MRLPTIALALALAGLGRAETFKATGWIEASYNASTAKKSNLPYGFDYFSDEGMLNQAMVSLNSQHVHADMFVGTDYFFTRAFGLFSGQHGEIGFDPLQFYLSGKVHKTDLKLGRFSSPIGAEYNAGPSNPLASHSYTFIYDPFTHTGLYGETPLSDRWTLITGLVTGCDVFVSPGVRGTGIGGARYTGKDAKKSLQLIAIVGPGRFDQQYGFNNVDCVDLTATYPLRERLLLTLQGTLGWEGNVPAMGDVSWQGLVNYLTWTFSKQLDGIVRFELFSDDQGNRTGFQGDYIAATLGFKWQPSPRWMLRPELRFDRQNGTAPFEGKHHLWTATLDAVWRW